MIQLDHVTKFYPTKNGRKYILKDVSAIFPKGKSVGVFGRNGTGKSTFVRLLGRIDYPNSGRILVDGTMSWPMALSGGFQGSLSGRDNAKFVCRVHGDSEKIIREKLAFIEAFAEIGEYFDERVSSYSSGMRSRLAFAVSMAFDFDYYLMDEVTAVGDPRFKVKARETLEAKREKSSVIFVSHNVGEIKRICDIGIYIEDGQLRVYDDINEAAERYQNMIKG
ncbi:MAG: ABC transporter ATP-binding protein [Cellvibrionales bacterium]|nr:ABC transporter ATP-binding protein [Cellvibrionales bacterium]